MKKTIIAVTMSAVLALTLIPFTASAADTDSTAKISVSTLADSQDSTSSIKDWITELITKGVTAWNNAVNWENAEEINFERAEGSVYFESEEVEGKLITYKKFFKYYTFTASDREDSTYTIKLNTDAGVCGIQTFYNKNGRWTEGELIAAEKGLSDKVTLTDINPGEKVRLLAVAAPNWRQPVTSLLSLGKGEITVKENIVVPEKEKITSYRAGKKKIFIKYNKSEISDASYEVAYKLAGKSYKKYTTDATSDYIHATLKPGKTYIVKVRAIRVVDEDYNVNGPWSDGKRIKTKK